MDREMNIVVVGSTEIEREETEEMRDDVVCYNIDVGDVGIFNNTAQEYDGSDSGAHPDEAISRGKIRVSAKSKKVHCDARNNRISHTSS